MQKSKTYLFKILLLTFFVVSFSFPAVALTRDNQNEPDHYVTPHLMADKTQVNGGETIRIGLEETIHPKWHVYWKNPGDSGTPTEINWELPTGFSVSELEFPAPLKIAYPPLTNYGHEGQPVFLQNLTLPDSIPAGSITLNATVNLLVCYDICIPETHKVSLTLNGDQQAEPQKIKAAEALLPLNKDWPASYLKKDENFELRITLEDITDLKQAKNIAIFPEDWGGVYNNADATLQILDTGFSLTQKAGERDFRELGDLGVVITYDIENQKEAIRVVAKHNPEQSDLAAAPAVNFDSAAAATTPKTGFLKAVFLALLGGLILNLMPCVFPVLSMKALSLVNLNDKEERKARAYGLFYTLGILISFAIIAGTLIALKAGGAEIGWGFQLQNPIMIIALIYLIFGLGLNLSGFFEFSGRLAGAGQNLSQKSGNKGAFFTGVLATLVATPCTAPFMGVAMGYALTQPAAISMVVFLALGFGLALPLLALCYFPLLRSKLPKPGAWMETFRQFLAFPMFITAAWLIWVLTQQAGSSTILFVLLGLIAITFAIWMARHFPKNTITKIVSIIFLSAAAFFILLPFFMSQSLTAVTSSNPTQNQNWEAFSATKLQERLEGDAPVFTNMTAAWCITCKVNERTSLNIEKTKNLFEKHKVSYLKGDWTNQNPDITQYLDSFERQGVPMYVYYGPRNNVTNLRPSPKLLPQILTPKIIEKALMETIE
jgi:thiol:disulfide interchange protein DsbD